MRIAMMGTRGVPALYGGFETAVEEVGSRLAERGYEVTVYCRNPGQKITQYKGMNLVNLPAIHHRIAETLSHTAVSSLHAIIRSRPDAVLLMNAGNAPFIGPLRLAKIPTAIHLDGLESQREKWRGLGARYYRWAEKSAVKNGAFIISDAQAIAEYILNHYGRESEMISYGAEIIDPLSDRLAELDLAAGEFHLLVARLEPENHVWEAVIGYTQSNQQKPLVLVGSSPYSAGYINRVKNESDSRTRFLGGIYDQELLNQLYAHCATYTHGHSVGGTNPSLLRAMGAGVTTLAFDCDFNREVTDNLALYWSSAESYAELLDNFTPTDMGLQLQERVSRVYQWDRVTDQYVELIERMVDK